MLLETRDTFSPPQQNAQIVLPDGVFPACDRTRSPIIRPDLSQRFLAKLAGNQPNMLHIWRHVGSGRTGAWQRAHLGERKHATQS